MSFPRDTDPRGAVVAAEVAVGEGEYETAEDALLEALSRVRMCKEGHGA